MRWSSGDISLGAVVKSNECGASGLGGGGGALNGEGESKENPPDAGASKENPPGAGTGAEGVAGGGEAGLGASKAKFESASPPLEGGAEGESKENPPNGAGAAGESKEKPPNGVCAAAAGGAGAFSSSKVKPKSAAWAVLRAPGGGCVFSTTNEGLSDPNAAGCGAACDPAAATIGSMRFNAG